MKTFALWMATATLLVGGCFEPDNAEDGGLDRYDDDDLPAGSCRDTGGDTDPCDTDGTTVGGETNDSMSGSSTGSDDRCAASDECDGGVCAAGWDPEALERLPLDCQFSCVPMFDDASWCADDSACCNEDARCTQRGYCVL